MNIQYKQRLAMKKMQHHLSGYIITQILVIIYEVFTTQNSKMWSRLKNVTLIIMQKYIISY